MLRRWALAWMCSLLVAHLATRPASARPPSDEPDEVVEAAPETIFKTLGGKQFWGDQLFYGQWRIQRNVLSGHCRLLDPENGCHALGSLEHCQAKLDQLKAEYQLPPATGPVVITLHGLGRSRAALNPLADHLREQGRYTVINVSYPSTRADIGSHAAALANIVDNLDQATEIHFVAHSLGNLVVRHYLADQADPKNGRRPDPRIRRIVMLGPPNQGALAATTFEDHWALRKVLGQSAQQIAGWDELAPRLATPQCEFGIIAGGRGNDTGYNPLLPGDDDGTVTVAETLLAGAHDFLLINVFHTFLTRDHAVLDATLRFLKHGHFAENGVRQPIDIGPPPGDE